MDGLAGTIKNRGITVYSGVGSLMGNELKVLVESQDAKKSEKQEIEASHIFLAAGSKPRELPSSSGLQSDGKNVITSDELFDLEKSQKA